MSCFEILAKYVLKRDITVSLYLKLIGCGINEKMNMTHSNTKILDTRNGTNVNIEFLSIRISSVINFRIQESMLNFTFSENSH